MNWLYLLHETLYATETLCKIPSLFKTTTRRSVECQILIHQFHRFSLFDAVIDYCIVSLTLWRNLMYFGPQIANNMPGVLAHPQTTMLMCWRCVSISDANTDACSLLLSSARTLRSSSQLLLYQLATSINFQSKAFSITAPAVWNSLSPVTKSSATITTLKAHLKTELFSAAYDTV